MELFIRARHADKVKSKSINNALRALRAIWNRAIRHGILKDNPFAKLDRLQEIPRPIVPLTPAEEAKLLTACAGDLELDAFVRFALDSGCRAGELCNLRRVDLDLDAGLGRVECNSEWKSKTRRNRAIAFTPATAARVRLWLAGRNGSSHVFRTAEDVKPRDCYYRLAAKFDDAARLAELKPLLPKRTRKHGVVTYTAVKTTITRNVTLQDLRRTVGSLLAARGINQRVAQEVLGHADISTTARFYQAVTPETIRGVVVNLRKTGTENGR